MIDAGTSGIKQMDLTQRVRFYATAAQVVSYLEWLKSQGKVDKFWKTNAGTSNVGNDSTIWRATTKITSV